MNQPVQAKWTVLSERIYCMLMILYPLDYRREYGALMVQIFRDVSRDRYRTQGIVGVILWWCKTLLDLTLTVIEQWRKVKFTMSKSILTRMMGRLLMIGGICVALAAFSQLQPGSHYTYRGVYQLAMDILLPGYFLIGIGNFGLATHYGKRVGQVGRGGRGGVGRCPVREDPLSLQF